MVFVCSLSIQSSRIRNHVHLLDNFLIKLEIYLQESVFKYIIHIVEITGNVHNSLFITLQNLHE